MVAQAEQPCIHSGAAFPLAQMMKLESEGGYAYSCKACVGASVADTKPTAVPSGLRLGKSPR